MEFRSIRETLRPLDGELFDCLNLRTSSPVPSFWHDSLTNLPEVQLPINLCVRSGRVQCGDERCPVNNIRKLK